MTIKTQRSKPPKCILILGGGRSGKSSLAVEMALERGGKVLFVATAEPRDEEMKRRISAHKKSRPESWQTLETPLNLGSEISKNVGTAKTVIIDCVTLLVNNIFEKYGEKGTAGTLEKAIESEITALLECVEKSHATFIIVSNEVGLGIIPVDSVSRLYRDLLGRANQALAARADQVYMLVAGLKMTLKNTLQYH